MFYAVLEEIKFLKWLDAINSNSWFLEILNGFSEGFLLFKYILGFWIAKSKIWYILIF